LIVDFNWKSAVFRDQYLSLLPQIDFLAFIDFARAKSNDLPLVVFLGGIGDNDPALFTSCSSSGRTSTRSPAVLR
jgi:hypothetical protein